MTKVAGPCAARPARRMAPAIPALLLAALAAPGAAQNADVQDTSSYVAMAAAPGRLTLSAGGRSAPLVAGAQDYPGVIRAVRDLRLDVGRVTGHEPVMWLDTLPPALELVVVGTLGRNPLIDGLVRAGRVDTAGISGRWEAFVLQTVEHPWPGVERALVIAGSDKRGTVYGVYDLSARIGVSPWYWWADVPVRHHDALFVKAGRYVQGPPAVKYRGIFLNDEAPALTGWAREKFGGLNHRF